jgi:hypothetical protein
VIQCSLEGKKGWAKVLIYYGKKEPSSIPGRVDITLLLSKTMKPNNVDRNNKLPAGGGYLMV